MDILKLDLHLHSIYSGDSLIKPSDIIKYAKIKGLDGVALTDHSTLKAFNILKSTAKKKDLILIPGMEIETKIGEVIGLFIDSEIITKDRDFFTIIDKIRDNNGLVVIPHPFDFLRDNHLKVDLLSSGTVNKCIDGVEIMNSRIIFKSAIRKAEEFNEIHQLFETGGSDAHTINEIGNGYTLLYGYEDVTLDSLRECLLKRKSKSAGKLSSPFVHMITVLNKIRKGLYF